MEYKIIKKVSPPAATENWDGQYWADIQAVTIDNFYDVPQASDHRPEMQAKVAHTGDAVHVFFRVKDQYVRCVNTEYQSSVCTDSCAEFFIQPAPGSAYFNFEINCGGTMLLYFIEDSTRGADGLLKFKPVEAEDGKMVEIHASQPKVVEPEIAEPTEWTIKFSFPVAMFEKYLGPLGKLAGQTWRGNFFKCGDKTSHPHWASWSPITNGELNFHQPEFFAPIIFGT